MYSKLYLYFIIFLWYHIVVAVQIDKLNELQKDEIDLYHQMFLSLNSIIKSNVEMKNELLELKGELMQLKENSRNEATPMISNDSSEEDPSTCTFFGKSRSNDDNISVYCFGDDWVTIQRRIDGSENFDRSWIEYKNGFGNTSYEFFIGLEKLYAITLLKPQELLILLKDFDNDVRYAKYDNFVIGSESEQYRLKELGHYTGSAGDSLSYHIDAKFSTLDRDNDAHANISCAQKFGGAWWYKACHESNLNGHYIYSDHDRSYASGLHWKSFRAHWYSLKFSQMMVRPKK